MSTRRNGVVVPIVWSRRSDDQEDPPSSTTHVAVDRKHVLVCPCCCTSANPPPTAPQSLPLAPKRRRTLDLGYWAPRRSSHEGHPRGKGHAQGFHRIGPGARWIWRIQPPAVAGNHLHDRRPPRKELCHQDPMGVAHLTPMPAVGRAVTKQDHDRPRWEDFAGARSGHVCQMRERRHARVG